MVPPYSFGHPPLQGGWEGAGEGCGGGSVRACPGLFRKGREHGVGEGKHGVGRGDAPQVRLISRLASW